MKVSLNWIKDFVDIDTTKEPQKLADLITVRTAEVEEVADLAGNFKNMVVGKIEKIGPHPDADKLQVTQTNVGGKTLQIVCGASNIYEGMLAPVAMSGAMVRWHGEGDPVELKPTKLRGVLSDGMLCAGEEIGVESKIDGIYDLTGVGFKEGTALSKVFSKDDVVIEIDNKSLTHRPDLWGHYGIAREIAAITGKPLKKMDLSKVKFPSSGESPKIEVKNFDLCPRYCGVIITGIVVKESPDWLKERLMAIGYRPISNIVDITNYVMAELGQPLHAFDKNYIKGWIIVRNAEKGEKITTLDGQERKLDEKTLLIADHEKAVAIAGIMGSENSEINDGTTEIIIESANFNPESIRKSSTRLGLRTEAVQRFEKSLDPVLAETAMRRTCQLILEVCPGAKIAGPFTDVNQGLPKPLKVDLDVQKVSSKIGVSISLEEAQKMLESLDFETVKKSEKILTVKIPSFRATKDVSIEDDLVEEITRLYGYENIDPTLPDLPIIVPMRNKERTLKHEVRKQLAFVFGMTEIYNYSFYGKDEMTKALIEDKDHIELQNYLSQDQTHLRTTLVPNMLKNIVSNLRFYEDIKIFEIGRTYREIGQYFPLEEKWIGGAIAHKKNQKMSPFYEAKSIVTEFLKQFFKCEVEISEQSKAPSYAHPSRCAKIKYQGQVIGNVFEVHPLVLSNFEIQAATAMFELNFTKMCSFDENFVKYSQIPKFPGIEIDVSVVIDSTKKVAELEKAIMKADENLIKRVRLFDIYEGENVGQGEKALAFRVLLQAIERTLTDEEMAKIQQKIFANLQKLGGTIRGI
ncbi:phenylalanine--tRNA ligase subunit beta [Patescibacteria group bacterium]|nr:phenylalanine--tRNA ligase subunit beta [Patescibacteria group bacterium]